MSETKFEAKMELIPHAQLSGAIPHKQVYNTPQRTAETFPKACFGIKTRDIEKIRG